MMSQILSLLLLALLVSLGSCVLSNNAFLSKNLYYSMSEEEQFIRGVCNKLRLHWEFPTQLTLSRRLLETCQCNRVKIPCLQTYECANVNTSHYRIGFVLSHDLHNVINQTAVLPIEQARDLRLLHPKSDVIFFLPNDVTIYDETLSIAKEEGIKILQRPYFQLSESLRYYGNYHEEIKMNCCGTREYLKFYAFSLVEYDVVFFFDNDIRVRRPLTPIINCMHTFDFLCASGHGLIVNGGMFVLKPNPKLWQALKEYLNTSLYNTKNGWNLAYETKGRAYGEEGVQGALYQFFYLHDRHALHIFNKTGIEIPLAAQLDRCMYNFMWRKEAQCHRIAPIIVHKNLHLLQKVEWMNLKLLDQEFN
eukprot:TRINITY_DN609_c0_g3_i1.p1 TRINITY_DN609_c0_g3~~TRINITY_DN609_c0_g3_i1.p1  ORF type:complete len:363 (-),score=3.99 TRINITY_DN609_c0_g3_i1:652-1740(-)